MDEFAKMRINVQGRSEGDGMENISFVDTASHSSNTFTKSSYCTSFASKGKRKEPKFVPYEPYKAAVSSILSDCKEKGLPIDCTIDSEKISLLASNIIKQNLSSVVPGVEELKPSECKAKSPYEQKCCGDCAERTNFLEQKLNQLEKERKELESQFNIQTQVNMDLKKMLIASLGEDMHLKLHYMIEDKAKLGKHVLDYSEELKQKDEEIDKISSQSNMWKSKFEACSLLIDDLAEWKVLLSQKFGEATMAIKSLLREHEEIYNNSQSTYSTLRQIQKAFDPNVTSTACQDQWNLLRVVHETRVLSNSVQARLLGDLCRKTSSSLTESRSFSPGEVSAYRVISSVNPVTLKNIEHSRQIKPGQNFMACQLLPHVCAKDTTVNCCHHCSGEVILL